MTLNASGQNCGNKGSGVVPEGRGEAAHPSLGLQEPLPASWAPCILVYKLFQSHLQYSILRLFRDRKSV